MCKLMMGMSYSWIGVCVGVDDGHVILVDRCVCELMMGMSY